MTLADALTIRAAHAIEVYNHTSTFHNDRGDSWWLSDQFSTLGRRLLAYGADDAHFSTRPDGFGCWVQVKTPELTPEALLQALKEGWFYTSQGPEIEDVQITADEIRIVCSAASTIFATGRGSTARHLRGSGLTAASFPLEPFLEGGFFRVTIIAADGTRAWTNPVWGSRGSGIGDQGSGTTKASR